MSGSLWEWHGPLAFPECRWPRGGHQGLVVQSLSQGVRWNEPLPYLELCSSDSLFSFPLTCHWDSEFPASPAG